MNEVEEKASAMVKKGYYTEEIREELHLSYCSINKIRKKYLNKIL